MDKILFTATKLEMFKKQGENKPDEDGYYELVVGGLNVHNNSKQWYYTEEGCRELFGPGSLIQRRVANGCLRAEVNHPKRVPGESDDSYANRMCDIDLNNVCAHFKEIWLDFNFGKNNPSYNNPKLIAIMAKVKPSGAKGQFLKEALDNKLENVCFSIRALADEYMHHGKRLRVLKEIIAIDYVNEGGITIASKWDSPATEAADNSFFLAKEALRQIAENSKSLVATESSREVLVYMAEKHLKKASKPPYAAW